MLWQTDGCCGCPVRAVRARFPAQHEHRRQGSGPTPNLGGIRESWTAACYILTAEFADALPADEDQMPIDGNPHPLPGQMQQEDNDFVMPQFPEIGWNIVPHVAHVQDDDFFQPEIVAPEMDHVEEQVQSSIVQNNSNSSGSSVNGEEHLGNMIVNHVRLVEENPCFSNLPKGLQFLQEFLFKGADQVGPVLPRGHAV